MNVHPIHTEEDYRAALKVVSKLVDKDPARDTPDGDRLEIWGLLVEAYEARHYPIDPPDPIEAIKFRMDQQGLKPKDLEPMIGQLNRVYEVLAGKRPLTLAMIRRLHDGLGIPAEILIRNDDRFALAA
ncbi:MAG: transcription regulator containing helix turn helix domain [Rhodoferax sp.]|nr:transcription regulator containing helix turn helix domain [Rhodoferax sp.]